MQRILDILQRIWAEMFVRPVRENAEFYFCVAGNPPFFLAKTDEGKIYKILEDGTTLLIAGVPNAVPLKGEFCPYPEMIWRLHVGIFFRQYGRLLPKIALVVIALLCVQVLLVGTGGEAFLPTFVAVMDCLLLFGLAASFVALVVWNYKRGLTIKFGDTDGLLSAGWPDIRPDILCVTESADEQPYILADKIENVRVEQQPGQWIVVLAYKNPAGVIICPDNEDGQRVEYAFRRDALMSDLPGWKQEVCTPRPFKYETWTEFVNYVRYFGEQYTEWAKWERSQSGNPSEELVSSLRAMATKAAVVIAFLLCSLVAFAGPQVPGQGSAVPVPERTTGGGFWGNSMVSNLPDSATLEMRKAAFIAERAQEWRKVQPVIDYYMWRFEISFLVIFIGIGGILWVFAKVAARDSIKDVYGAPLFGDVLTRMHIWSKGALFLILSAITAVYLCDAIVRYYYTGGMPTFWTLVKWGFICWLWYKAFEFILPDTPGSKPEHQMRGLGGGNNFPRIG